MAPFYFPNFCSCSRICTLEILKLGALNEKEHVTCVFVNLCYLSQYDLFEFHPFTFKIRDFFFLTARSIPLSMYRIFIIDSSVVHLGCFHFLHIVNRVVTSTTVEVSVE